MRHSSDSEPGIHPQAQGHRLGLFRRRGQARHRPRRDRPPECDRLPPAYADAWFCTDRDGHLQATGIDARGRKQYRYHPDFTAKRANTKFDGLHGVRQGAAQAPAPGRAGSQAPQRSAAKPCWPRSSACSTPSISASATSNMPRDNKSFGATTLRTRHIRTQGRKLIDALQGQARDRPRSADHRQPI